MKGTCVFIYVTVIAPLNTWATPKWLPLSISEETEVMSTRSHLVSQQFFINHYVSDNTSGIEEAALSRQSLCAYPMTLRGDATVKLLMPRSVW